MRHKNNEKNKAKNLLKKSIENNILYITKKLGGIIFNIKALKN